MARTVASEELERIFAQPQTRALAESEIRAVDDEARTIELSFSSEAPCERWFGTEILSHDEGAMDMSRLNAGASLLFNHSQQQYIGVVEKAWIKDKRGYCQVRFDTHPHADQIYQSVKSKILKGTSVGYTVSEWLYNEKEDIYTFTRWLPLEVSICTVAVDGSVGVGRSTDGELVAGLREMLGMALKGSSPEKTPPVIQDKSITPIVVTGERAMDETVTLTREEENAQIRALCAEFNCQPYGEVLVKAGCTMAESRAHIIGLVTRGQTPAGGMSDMALGLSSKEKQRYSVARAVLANLEKSWDKSYEGRTAGLEREVHEELEKRAQKSGIELRGGVLLPIWDLDTEFARDAKGHYVRNELGQILTRATLNVGTAGQGGNLVQTELGSMIELLRNNAAIMRLNPTILDGLTGNLDLPRQTAGSASGWVAESGNLAQSDATFDLVSIRPKTAGAFSAYTRMFLLQAMANPSVDAFMRNDLAVGLALTMDLGALRGTGSSSQPTGIMNASGVGSVVFGTNGAVLTWPKIVEFGTKVNRATSGNLPGKAWLVSPEFVGSAQTTPKIAGQAVFLMDSENGNLNGYRVEHTTQMPNNLTKGSGTNLTGAVFGAWSQLIVALWGLAEVMGDPYTLFTSGGVRVRIFQTMDIQTRHPEAFSVASDIITT